MNLGIIWKDGCVIHHRSLLKVVLNPFLRMFGFQIGSVFENNILQKIVFVRCEKRKYISSWKYELKDETIEKRRMFI